MWKKAVVFVLHVSCILHHVSAVGREELFPYGTPSGDWTLQEGDDETSEVMSLSRPMHFYDTSFSKLYVATNGIISPHDLPMEKQYVDDGFPTEFPVIAPFLADIDTSNGKGAIYYRQTESPGVLNRIAAEVRKGFPDTQFTPTHAIIATWENVAAYTAVTHTSEASREVNTFQAVVAYDEENTYALFLYPEDGLQFFGTRPKEMFNVEIELPARVGFTRGEIPYLFFTRTEGPFFSLTSKEQSVKNLYQTGNTGVPGVWLFHIGNADTFDNVIPAQASGHLPTTVSKNRAVEFQTTPEYPTEEYENPNESFDEETEYNMDPDFQNPDATEFPQAVHDASLLSGLNQEADSNLSPLDPDAGDVTLSPDRAAQTNVSADEIIETVHPVPRHTLLEAYPIHPEGEVVTVEEDLNVNSEVIIYSENKETCDHFQQTCSQHAYCTNYPSGYCCHCHAGFYGNGRYCLPDGAPQRVNGKVSGVVSVGSTPVRLDSNDLHAYIVAGDGRAYTAISEVPEPLGWALMPVTPIGGLFGWLFALKLPNSHNGFSITGAEFIRHADVTFHPGNQRLTIVQTARGLDRQNYLNVETHLEGSVPFVPPSASIQMEPFSETYQYYPSLITSNSVREFTIVSAQSGAETFTFRLRQNITYRDCSHTPRAGAETLQLDVERMFAMYVNEERVLRYAVTNKIGQAGAYIPDPVQVNPCYSGSHDCDTTAQCVPGDGQHYACVCATGYTGDGRNCYDVDECAEGLSSCGSHAQCVNLPGSHSCQCQSGFEYGRDTRTCIDVDECRRHPCHPHASCANTVGSFRCRCQPGFHGDGVQCHRQHIDDVRPKTQCEQHRDSASGGVDQSGVGAFVPQCDEEGRYRSQQCHGSTGHCWCVDSRGRERARTRTRPGTPPVDCDAPERPKTQCEHHRDSVREGAVVGAFIPQCDEEGHYRSLQCHGSTGHCWCVDSRGQERVGTRTPTGTPPTNCDAPERPKTECEQQRHNAQHGADGVPVLGAFIPHCDEEGRYRSRQCHGSTGHCWCVDSRGQERAGTRTPPGTPPADCDAPERPKTPCEQHRDSIQNRPGGLQPVGGFTPECDEEGRYRSRQCHGSTGHCWCVDSRGQEREGTRTAPGTPHANCDAPERPKTQCEQQRDRSQERADRLALEGVFIPECDEEGRYRSRQCHGSTGHCWCVDSRGQERAGTRTPPGTPSAECDAPERPKTPCEQHRDSVQNRPGGLQPVGAFTPECDEEGRYRSRQCHGSTGHCWCVDSRGQERAGTRTAPGTPHANCDAPERPKTPCEQQRDHLQERAHGLPLVGVFIPKCDEEGRYRPQQCHGSSGHCWCVDSRGQERAGTHTPPGTAPADCDAPVHVERPKTQCEQYRDHLHDRGDGLPVLGAFVPQCDEEGRYKSLQCHGSTGHCWCVDSRGQEREGTRTQPGTPHTNCDAPERPKTPCEQHRDGAQSPADGFPVVGSFIPQCDEEGNYRPRQCHGSTGHCWCVDSRGQERAGTRTPPGTPHTNCDAPERPKTPCEQHRDRAQSPADGFPVVGSFIPQCDEEGRYESLQCHGSTGYCWCVDSRGQERAGTRTPPGTPHTNCDAPERPKTPCEQHRDRAQRPADGFPVVGSFIPQCDEEGHYRPRQCHGSTGHCWCVDSRGQERAGTRTPPGTPHTNCDAPERPKTPCEQHRDGAQSPADGFPVVGSFIPQCDEEGRYESLQCHGSTGHCWCVDSRGQERAGTRTPPGTPHTNCDAPERPKTPCEQHRDRAQSPADGFPVVGSFIPQCDEEGHYRPRQCHGSTGHCWCVDSRGQERAGTRTPPGTPHANCDAPERPKTPCEQHRDGAQRPADGFPVVGAFIPQCDEEGNYRPRQCHGSTGHCWCVDSRGQERAGTRTPPGTPHTNCDAPERPKTPCEQHRDGAQSPADGFPVVGSFIPQCDEEGHYRPRQCHGSTGHCWCVDSRGQERAGTRTPPGTSHTNCDAPVAAVPTQRPETVCERWRASLMEHYGGRPGPEHFLPQCDASGEFTPVQCYGETSYCWCVDKDGREVAGTRSHDKVKPACIPTVPPLTIRPLPRPDVTPPPSGTTLLYAQGQQIGALPLNGTRMDKDRSSVLLALHGSIVVGIDYDCRERKVYWTDLAGRTISRAALEPGSEPEILINTGLMSPEGLAVDVARRRMFWVDSTPDKIESAKLDGSDRRVLFNTDLVNPRAIVVDSLSGTLYWTDWNREAPKIESSTVEGHNRRVLVRDGIGLPNALTVDPTTRRICWADAGTKRLECIAPDGTGRRVIHNNLNYPFSMVFYADHFYYTDWRRDGVIGLSRDSSQFTDEYLPDQRSHLYGITVASSSCL